MPKKRCKKDNYHKITTDKFFCKGCGQTANDKEKLCKPDKS